MRRLRRRGREALQQVPQRVVSARARAATRRDAPRPGKEERERAAPLTNLRPSTPLLSCDRPLRGRYCSRECQLKAWKGHKALCKLVADDRAARGGGVGGGGGASGILAALAGAEAE